MLSYGSVYTTPVRPRSLVIALHLKPLDWLESLYGSYFGSRLYRRVWYLYTTEVTIVSSGSSTNKVVPPAAGKLENVLYTKTGKP